jgi:hypothetical protein
VSLAGSRKLKTPLTVIVIGGILLTGSGYNLSGYEQLDIEKAPRPIKIGSMIFSVDG